MSIETLLSSQQSTGTTTDTATDFPDDEDRNVYVLQQDMDMEVKLQFV